MAFKRNHPILLSLFFGGVIWDFASRFSYFCCIFGGIVCLTPSHQVRILWQVAMIGYDMYIAGWKRNTRVKWSTGVRWTIPRTKESNHLPTFAMFCYSQFGSLFWGTQTAWDSKQTFPCPNRSMASRSRRATSPRQDFCFVRDMHPGEMISIYYIINIYIYIYVSLIKMKKHVYLILGTRYN